MTGLAAPVSEADALVARLGVPAKGLTSDSRRLRAGDLFAAYPGARDDGRAYIGDAIARGAAGVIWDPRGFAWDSAWKITQLPVEHLKDRLGALADVVYGHPSRKLWVVGVTGTNGKTSCAHWIAHGLEAAGHRAAILGTLGNGLVGALAESANTTLDAARLHETLAAFQAAGADCVAMEVSSHGIEQGRINAVSFEVAMFTNLTRDHLDYHVTMAAYGAAKAKLFAWPGLGTAVINADDDFGQSLIESTRARGREVLSYGFGAADVAGSGLVASNAGLRFGVATSWGKGEVQSALVGAFNASNLLGVLAVLLVSGVPFDRAMAYVRAAEAPPGRMQRLGGGRAPLVVIDYAHTADALEKALLALRASVAEGGELMCVFGCGGDRDAGKRPEMGRVAAGHSDRVLVTSDNPRSEDPAAIATEIVHGIRATGNQRYAVMLDRAKAIETAIRSAKRGDVVLIAGKGHETYQESAGRREPFSDCAQAAAALDQAVPAVVQGASEVAQGASAVAQAASAVAQAAPAIDQAAPAIDQAAPAQAWRGDE